MENGILIIDDDRELCELLRDYLGAEGFIAGIEAERAFGAHRRAAGQVIKLGSALRAGLFFADINLGHGLSDDPCEWARPLATFAAPCQTPANPK